MRNSILTCLIGSLFVAQSAFAAGKSAKKMEADRAGISPAQVIEAGDMLIGVRTSTGAAFDNATVMGVNLERIIGPNFGVGVQAHYANYDFKYGAGDITGEYDTDVFVGMIYGAFHADIFKTKNLDTFFLGGIARSEQRGDFTTTTGIEKSRYPKDTKEGSNILVGSFNARYFVDASWSFTATMGTGLGNFGIGMDYLF